MLKNIYKTDISANFKTFQFESVGPKGTIIKVVKYTETEIAGVFNLGFGDRQANSEYLNDLIITDNKDSQKVLATVASTLYAFIDEYPNAVVIAEGSTRARTRLYQMGIANNLEVIEITFIVFGFTGTDWELFKRNVSYSAFLAYRKV